MLYGVSVVLACAAIAVSLGKSWQVGAALIAASAVVIGLVRFVGYFEYVLVMRRQRARVRSEETERLRRALPAIIGRLTTAENESTVFAALEDLVNGSARFGAVELVPADGHTLVRSWSRDLVADPSELVSSRYPLGEDSLARTHLRVRWWCANGDVDAQTDVLLQVVADVVADAFGRVASEHAPLESPLESALGEAAVGPFFASAEPRS
jgi:hypothetical protein